MLPALLMALGTAHAQDVDYAGSWTASELRITNQITSWGPDCGRRPPGSYTEPGGAVTIAERGDHLAFSGAVRGATNRCWSDRPGLRRLSTRFQGERWTTSCETPDDDAQPESGRYTFRAESPSRLVYEERTEWNWRLNSSTCRASRVARRTFTRVGEAPPPTMEETPPDPPEMEEAPCTPGAPARVRVSPSDETIQPGERVCFRARVVDAAGCTVRGQSVELELREAPGREGRLDARCFVAGASAATAEGEFRVVARSGDLRGSARVLVRSEDLSHLTATGREREEREDGLSAAEAEAASGLSARALRGSGGSAWLLGGGAALLLLLVAAALLFVRRRKGQSPSAPPGAEDIPDGTAPPPPRPSAPAGATAKPPRRVCPVCGHEDETGNAFCPKDGATLLDPDDPTVRAQGMICPTCRRGYPADADRCVHDQDTLVPYALFVARGKASESSGKKVCPVCGETYDEGTTFCGKDGATLETVN